MPSLLEQLQGMYGQPTPPADPLSQPVQPQSIEQMMATQPYAPPPPPGQLDAATADATGAPPPAPAAGAPVAGGSLGHPDVLSKLKEILAKNGQGSAPDPAQNPAVSRGLLPNTETIKQEQGGPNAAQRATDVAVHGQAELDSGGIQQSRLHQQADQLEQQARQLRVQAQVEDEQRKKAEAENAQKQERLRTQQMQLAEQKDAPINPNRYFQNMSIFSKAAAVISAFSYGYLNPKGGGAAPIIGTLTDMARQDVQAQLADAAANRDRRGSLISQYDREYGDTTLVAKRLEADKLMTLAKQARAESTSATSDQAKAQAEDLGKQLDVRATVLNEEIQKATLAKPVEVTTTFARPPKEKAGAPGDTLKKWAEADKALEERGIKPDDPQRVALRTAFGVAKPSGDSELRINADEKAANIAEKTANAKQKQKDLSDQQGKIEAAHADIENFAIASGKVIKQNGKWVPAPNPEHGSMHAFFENVPGARKEVHTAQQGAIQSLAHVYSRGNVNDEALKQAEDFLPLYSSAQNTADKLNAADSLIEARRKGYSTEGAGALPDLGGLGTAVQ